MYKLYDNSAFFPFRCTCLLDVLLFYDEETACKFRKSDLATLKGAIFIISHQNTKKKFLKIPYLTLKEC